MKIGARMGAAFGVVLALVAINVAASFYFLTKIDKEVDHITESNNVRMVKSAEVLQAVLEISGSLRNYVIMTDPKQQEHELQDLAAARTRYKKDLAKLEELEKNDEGKKLLLAGSEAIKAAKGANDKVIELVKAGKRDLAMTVIQQEASPLTRKVEEAYGKVTEYQKERTKMRLMEVGKNATEARTIALVLGLISIVLGASGAAVISRSITKPLGKAVEVANRLAAGDLALIVEVSKNTKDETGQMLIAMQNMVSSLREMVSGTVQISSGIASASSQLHATSQQIATGAEEVASQTGTVATASEEMSATSSDIARNCSMAADAARQSTDSATIGARVVQDTIVGMELIAQRVRTTSQTVETLGSSSEKIGAIIGTIEDIADQTNLLALNAAIEAARAGEQGRGFAVVADEVRALAERTGRATKEIGEMIKAIQHETKQAVSAMEEGVREVEKGAASAQKSGEALDNIILSIGEVSIQVNQIATAAEQQTATTSEVTNNIQQITEVVQQTARGADETAGAAAQLASQARELQNLVSRFQLK
jgi:methyl-accepting chemotaxis protein